MASKLTPEEKEAKKKRSAFTNFIKNVLRRGSYRWPARSEAEKAARVSRGMYKCAICQGTFHRKECELDHVDPVVPIKESWEQADGSPDWNIFIKRLFCEKEGYQMICKICHAAKTTQEDTMRAFYHAKRKEDEEK